jgi:hypothetical protein
MNFGFFVSTDTSDTPRTRACIAALALALPSILACGPTPVGGGSGGSGGGPSGEFTPAPGLPAPDARGPYQVVIEENVGAGYENPINVNDQPGATFCRTFASIFGQDPAETEQFVTIPPGMNMALYTLYRPSNFEPGKRYPVLTWGNGTCALPRGYNGRDGLGLLSHVASHGFIVIAANSRWVGSGQPLLRGLSWVIEQNGNPSSPLYGKVDTARVGAFGHSQGGGATSVAGRDPRVSTTILLNGGGSSGLRGPTYVLTGEQDLAPASAQSAYNSATVPAAFINLKSSDHITLITEPARVAPSVTAWFRYHLLRDSVGRGWFAGSSCQLCNRPAEWTYLSKNLP